MFWLRTKADDEARAELVHATNRIELMVQTMPPRTWRDEYAAALSELYEALFASHLVGRKLRWRWRISKR